MIDRMMFTGRIDHVDISEYQPWFLGAGLIKLPPVDDGKTLIEAHQDPVFIKRNGILVRWFDIPGITDFVRIPVGTPADMESLLGIMRKMKDGDEPK